MKKNNLNKGVAIDDESLKMVGGGGHAIFGLDNKTTCIMSHGKDVFPYVADTVSRGDYNSREKFIDTVTSVDQRINPNDKFTKIHWNNDNEKKFSWKDVTQKRGLRVRKVKAVQNRVIFE